MRINQNIMALNSRNNLSNTEARQAKSLEKLSSGFRINRAADDAAGLAISEGLRSQVGGLKMAIRNTQDGISVVQTAEGALTETHAILQRMRDLTVQASNSGGLNDDAKGNIQSELSQLKDELTRIADTTTFNGTKLLDGGYDGKFQVGANVGETISVEVDTAMSAAGLKVDGVDVTAETAGMTGSTTQAATAAQVSIATVGAGATPANNFTLSETFDKLSGTISYGGKSVDLSTVKYEAGSTAGARLTKVQEALDATFGTNKVVAGATADGITFTGADTHATGASAEEVAAVQVKFTQATGSDDALVKIDAAIKTVSTTRADLGAVQNRFDHTIRNLAVTAENLTASESRIRDTDMASEMMEFTRNQILSQAGTAMLAQANQVPQGVLSLLR
ncbi:flagellin [Euzebya sp.]|uniref:flagellin N-terminal helical domain-containing protein n=1 Tax=Euzebya sp. TaxID=1971409 RepID=UPI0035155E40